MFCHAHLVLSKYGIYLFPVELYAEERSVSIDSNLVLLECILAGEFSGSGNIQWSYNGQILRDGDKYQVFTANNIDCTYGKCHRSQLQIRQANANDVGTYTCTFEDMSEDITLMNVTGKLSSLFLCLMHICIYTLLFNSHYTYVQLVLQLALLAL